MYTDTHPYTHHRYQQASAFCVRFASNNFQCCYLISRFCDSRFLAEITLHPHPHTRTQKHGIFVWACVCMARWSRRLNRKHRLLGEMKVWWRRRWFLLMNVLSFHCNVVWHGGRYLCVCAFFLLSWMHFKFRKLIFFLVLFLLIMMIFIIWRLFSFGHVSEFLHFLLLLDY